MTNEKAIMCLEDMKIKVPIPKAAKQARENNEALDVAIKALAEFEHGTNLSEVGTDCSEFPNNSDTISRQAAIDIVEFECGEWSGLAKTIAEEIKQLPPVQPDIIRCRNCKFASGDSRICMKFGHSPIGELDFCSFAERREVNSESN